MTEIAQELQVQRAPQTQDAAAGHALVTIVATRMSSQIALSVTLMVYA